MAKVWVSRERGSSRRLQRESVWNSCDSQPGDPDFGRRQTESVTLNSPTRRTRESGCSREKLCFQVIAEPFSSAGQQKQLLQYTRITTKKRGRYTWRGKILQSDWSCRNSCNREQVVLRHFSRPSPPPRRRGSARLGPPGPRRRVRYSQRNPGLHTLLLSSPPRAVWYIAHPHVPCLHVVERGAFKILQIV